LHSGVRRTELSLLKEEVEQMHRRALIPLDGWALTEQALPQAIAQAGLF
jgi:hypothetical protein